MSFPKLNSRFYLVFSGLFVNMNLPDNQEVRPHKLKYIQQQNQSVVQNQGVDQA